MLDRVKFALRVSNNKFDEEINDLIQAGVRDLKISGVNTIDESDPLIVQAIKTYCKAYFWADNKDSERYINSYESIKQHLSLCGEYNE